MTLVISSPRGSAIAAGAHSDPALRFDAVEKRALHNASATRAAPRAARQSRSDPVLLSVGCHGAHSRASQNTPCSELSGSPELRRDTCCGSEPCERRGARDRRETASAGPSPAQVTDLRLRQPVPGAAVSRAVERFAEQRVSRRRSASAASPVRTSALRSRRPELPSRGSHGTRRCHRLAS